MPEAEFQRRQSDKRLDKIEEDLSCLDEKYDELKALIDVNSDVLGDIQKNIEPLQDISDGIKGLHVLGKLFMWVGGIAGAIAVAYNVIKNGSGS